MTPEELAEIRFAFALETAENLSEMETALLALENRPEVGDDFNALFRAMHTIKGSAGIVDASFVELFCHSAEHLLSRIREHELPLTTDLISLFLQCHDHIRSLVAAYEQGEETVPAAHEQLLSSIKLLLELPAQETADSPPESDHSVKDSQLAASSTVLAESNSERKIVKVESIKLDLLINLVVELVTATSELEAHVKRSGDPAATESVTVVSALVKQVQERAMVFRMVPVNDLFRRFQRLLHDLSLETGKELHLKTSGAETELDKVLAEKLREPLLHLVRNAADHGIEAPEARLAAGKPAFGTISLNAWQEAGNIMIEVSDDGQGLNQEKIIQKAMERGLVRQEDIAVCDPLSLIFMPGFSTMETASTLSGRGVGMDVVKQTVESVRGRIEVSSTKGQGSSFRIRLPLSLAMIDGFMVTVGSNLYIMPMELVSETIDLMPDDLHWLENHGYHNLRGEAIPCLDLRKLLQADCEQPKIRSAVVVNVGNKRTALVVDHLEGAIKAVIKPLGNSCRDLRIISGATILGDGTIALILDLPELLASP